MTESSSSFFPNVNWKAGKKRNVDLKNVLPDDFEKIDVEEPAAKTKVLHFEHGKSVVEKVEIVNKKEVIIPKVIEEDWRVKRLRQKETEGTLTDEDRARLALLLEASGESTSTKVEQINVPERSNEEPDDPDYDAIDISEFGMAILRGYGFKEDEGIGKTNKKSVKLATPVRRKNVGVGAVPVSSTGDTSMDGDEDLKILKPGKCVHIERGKLEGKYGIVVSMDPDNSVCYIKLAIPGKNKEHVKVSEFNLRIVPKTEYDKKSKVINNKEYDQFKTEEPVISSTAVDISQNGIPKKKRKESISSESDSADGLWAVEDLRVRIISKSYKGGKYYKEKMVIVDANSRKYVTLSDQYKRHHEVKRSHIETVIPRGIGGRVMLLTGKYKGQIGKIVERDEKSEFLRIHVSSMDFVTDVKSFDDVCEYVGYLHND
uniref:G-patch domain-containing protein n=1 Tax=Panagrolaimus sp. JU765 TaxID=591449 RepID=A0AC34Q2G9_9BILA